MARRFTHVCDFAGQRVPYSPKPRKSRGKWSVVFNGPDGGRLQLTTVFEIKGKHPPEDFHAEAQRLIVETYRPPGLFPTLERKSWEELLAEIEKTSPHTRPETIRSFRAAIKAVREVLPSVTAPADVAEEHVRRFARLWLAAPSRQGGGKRSPVTLSYYLRALSAFTNHLRALGYTNANHWRGFKTPKGEKRRKPVPTEKDISKFFIWVQNRYPDWKALHAILNVKAVSGCRTADVCQLRTSQLGKNSLTFAADASKTKDERILPLARDLAATLAEVAGPVYLWETLFREIPKHRKASNGIPPAFSWRTVYHVLNNIFREYSDEHPDRPRLTPHALRRRAITAAVRMTGSIDAGASIIGVHGQTAKTHYLDQKQAFDNAAALKRLAAELMLSNSGTIAGPKRPKSKKKP